jgi:hypothetical protein
LKATLLLAALFTLNLADAALTAYGLSIGLAEANPVYPSHNQWLKLAMPLIFAIFWLTAYNYTSKHGLWKFTRLLKTLLYGLVAFYAAVTAWNTLIILRVGLG